MKRFVFLFGVAFVWCGVSFITNCSDPLESGANGPDPGPVRVDTLYDIDTVTVIDTTVVYDTTSTTDTVSVIDTVVVIDTTVTTDTIAVIDTVVVVDTTNTTDTVEVVDTVVVVDTTTTTDTISVIDTVVVFDTTTISDTTVIVDSVIIVDTTTVTDTTVIVDTVHVTDTITNTDTVVVIDTVIDVDTVVVTVPDTTAPALVCSRIAANQQDVVWMLRNPAGAYTLEFTAVIERNQPNQSLTVTIDGHDFIWEVGQNLVFTTDLVLSQNSTIHIVPNRPPARGHSIDICLTITPR